jgi:ribonucleoside-diphosphate reductase beta chain
VDPSRRARHGGPIKNSGPIKINSIGRLWPPLSIGPIILDKVIASRYRCRAVIQSGWRATAGSSGISTELGDEGALDFVDPCISACIEFIRIPRTEVMLSHSSTSTSTTQKLRTKSLPKRLYEKAKDDGAWNPSQLDLAVDKAHWDALRGQDRVPILALAVLGAHGLRARLHNQAMMLVPIERNGTIEESLCYSSHLYETARHVEFHNRLLEDVFHLVGNPQRFHLAQFHAFFNEQVPQAVDKLQSCSKPRLLAEALTLTGPLGKGVLTATGNFIFTSMLEHLEIMPTTLSAMRHLRSAVRRHNEFEMFFIGRLIQRDPALWQVVDDTMQAGFEPSVGMIREFFDNYSTTHVARAEAVTSAVERFSECYERLEMSKEPTYLDDQSSLDHSSLERRSLERRR